MPLDRRVWLLVMASAVLGTAPVIDERTRAPARRVSDAGVAKGEVPENPPALPELARQLLRRRMERHGKDSATLWIAVTLLQREVVAELSDSIAGEPRLVRPLQGNGDELNSMLPEKFFVLQDVVRDRAKQLASAARTGSDAQMAQAFGRLAETCVACHSAFLDPRGR